MAPTSPTISLMPRRLERAITRCFARAGYTTTSWKSGIAMGRSHRYFTTQSLYRDEGGQVVGVFAAARDITERKRAEQQLRRVNRALRTISECNQAMVRVADESHLLDDVCRILVREGGYRMAWVGYVENDEGKSVRPVAHVGFEAGYLQAASITWADTERGRGPTGTAIRTGKPVVGRDFQADPSLAPWREEALRRGYASSIALPIRLNGHVLGALTIYAKEAEAFDSAEVQLATELSKPYG